MSKKTEAVEHEQETHGWSKHDQEKIQRERVWETIQLRERSGNMTDTEALVDFLYTLMRDHLPTGVVERLVQDATIEKRARKSGALYTNGWLALYAQDLAERLTDA